MIYELINWPFTHEATFWSLLIMFGIGWIIGRGSHGQWRQWFED